MNVIHPPRYVPSSPDKKEIHNFLLDIAGVAQNITLKYFRTNIDVENKNQSGFDPVTMADRQTEKAIRDKIAQQFPDHGIVGEEYGATVSDSKYNWVIDPIDGTRAFISGLPVWGTLVALCYEGYPVAGLMSQPYTGEHFVSTGEQTVLCRAGDVVPVRTSAVKTLSGATLFTTSPRMFHTIHSQSAYDRLEDQTRFARYGLDCYGYAMVAAGHGELVVEEGLKHVDVAAMIPIIEGAGGIITSWTGQPVTTGGQVVAAANKRIHQAALEILAPAAMQ